MQQRGCKTNENFLLMSSGEISAALAFGKFLDRVSEHRARHPSAATSEESTLGRAVAIADFTQHPADRLVNQVVWIGDQQVGDRKSVVELTAPDEAEGREDGNAPLP